MANNNNNNDNKIHLYEFLLKTTEIREIYTPQTYRGIY